MTRVILRWLIAGVIKCPDLLLACRLRIVVRLIAAITLCRVGLVLVVDGF